MRLILKKLWPLFFWHTFFAASVLIFGTAPAVVIAALWTSGVITTICAAFILSET